MTVTPPAGTKTRHSPLARKGRGIPGRPIPVPRFSSASAHFAGAGCGAGAVAGVSLISILAIVRVTTDFFAAALRTLVFAAFVPAARRLRVAAAFLPAAFLFGLKSRHPCLCTICTASEPKLAGVARKTCLLVDGKTTPGLWGRDCLLAENRRSRARSAGDTLSGGLQSLSGITWNGGAPLSLTFKCRGLGTNGIRALKTSFPRPMHHSSWPGQSRRCASVRSMITPGACEFQ